MRRLLVASSTPVYLSVLASHTAMSSRYSLGSAASDPCKWHNENARPDHKDTGCRHVTLALVGCMAIYFLVSIAGTKTQCWHQLCAFAWFKTLNRRVFVRN